MQADHPGSPSHAQTMSPRSLSQVHRFLICSVVTMIVMLHFGPVCKCNCLVHILLVVKELSEASLFSFIDVIWKIASFVTNLFSRVPTPQFSSNNNTCLIMLVGFYLLDRSVDRSLLKEPLCSAWTKHQKIAKSLKRSTTLSC